MSDPRYPLGPFVRPAAVTPEQRAEWVAEIAATPAALRAAVAGLDDAQLDTPYREGGWTVRQLVHHLPDSHLNAYLRFKWATTEDTPAIKAYDEKGWAELADSRTADSELSLVLLEALHGRWVAFLHLLGDADWRREFVHPKHGPMTLEVTAAMYAWHGRHHVAHITELRRRQGW